MNQLGILDIKSALTNDLRFRELFPELAADIQDFLKNPGCPCHANLYRKILGYKERLQRYFPTKQIPEPDDTQRNKWRVINCAASELERQMQKLPRGRVQIAVARWQDQVTVVVNELE